MAAVHQTPSHQRATRFDRALARVHRWIWRDADHRVPKLLGFGATETDGGRDIQRAAEKAATRAVFEEILHDETFHMNYTLTQLVRVSPQSHRWHLWRARLKRLWKAYLRIATALAGVIGAVFMLIQYFVLLPPFAFLAKRSQRREVAGWTPISPTRNASLTKQY
ncbi:MAG: hypothetical protein C5B57_02800 [Blastocatellia bacterium]|nr:MAG: hypothetical protein C5B57_02800 [Blastocatellia bacterium]